MAEKMMTQENKKNKQSFKIDRAKGTRDFGPSVKMVRDNVIETIKTVFESYGFAPLETPVMERLDILTAKNAAGDKSEVVSEMFCLKDRGGRKLGLRYEFTVSLARYMAMNQRIPLPFRRYQIGINFRDGPLKAGRFREFYQCDVDTIGITGLEADAEIITLLQDVFTDLKLDIVIKINSRKLLNDILDAAKINEDKKSETLVIIDKFEKIGRDGVLAELLQRGIKQSQAKNVLDLIGCSLQELQDQLPKDLGTESSGVTELRELFMLLDRSVVAYEFVPSLVRGQGYYTGPIFEVFRKGDFSLGSLAGGGRWDNMIGNFSGRNLPAVGFGFGLEPVMEILLERELENQIGEKSTPAEVMVVPVNDEPAFTRECAVIAKSLRDVGINVLNGFGFSSLSKALEFANRVGIGKAIIIGKKELECKAATLRNLVTGVENIILQADILDCLNIEMKQTKNQVDGQVNVETKK